MHLITRAIRPCYRLGHENSTTDLDVGLQWTDGSRLSDLDYADDIVLLETSRDRMQQLTAVSYTHLTLPTILRV